MGNYDKTWNNYDESEDVEFKKITGWDTKEELAAYEKGRADEQTVIFKFIKEYDGYTNSEFGQAMKDTFDRLNSSKVYSTSEVIKLLHQIVNDSHCHLNRVKYSSFNNCAEFVNKWVKNNNI